VSLVQDVGTNAHCEPPALATRAAPVAATVVVVPAPVEPELEPPVPVAPAAAWTQVKPVAQSASDSHEGALKVQVP
jgi:hypothetical protein